MVKQYGTPGPRALYPDVCTSPSLAACDPLAQLLFDRLLTLADDQGRVQTDVNWVKANAVPYVSEATPRRIGSWIVQLSRHELLVTYTSNSVELGQFVTWWARQSGQRRAYPSRWPAPPGWDQDRTYGLPRDESPGAKADPQRPKLPAGSAQSAGQVRAGRGQDARNVPDENPPRARNSVPLPMPTTPPTPPPAGGRRNGPIRSTKYEHLVERDDVVQPTADVELEAWTR